MAASVNKARGRGGRKEMKGQPGDNVYEVKNTGKRMVSGSSGDRIEGNRDVNARRTTPPVKKTSAETAAVKMRTGFTKKGVGAGSASNTVTSAVKKTGGGRTQRSH
jgi:hypothetical protein